MMRLCVLIFVLLGTKATAFEPLVGEHRLDTTDFEMELRNAALVPRADVFELTGEVYIMRNKKGAKVKLTVPGIAGELCDAVVGNLPEIAPSLAIDQLFQTRFELRIKNTTNNILPPLPAAVIDGKCKVLQKGEQAFFSSLPPIQNWILTDFDAKDKAMNEITVTFQPLDGAKSTELDVIGACESALYILKERFAAVKAKAGNITAMKIIAKRQRGFSFANFSTSVSWTVPVTDGICGAKGKIE